MTATRPAGASGPARQPDLDALRILVLVGELGSVGRAAQAAGIAQPSASARLASLERRLGLALADRSPRGSALTADGKVVSDWARDVLAAADSLVGGVDALRRRRSAELRVAASMTVAECLMPAWLHDFNARRPQVRVGLQVANSAQVLRSVLEGDADLGFVERPGRLADLSSKVVAVDRLVVVVPAGHVLSRRRRPLTAADLARTPLVVREAGSGTRETLGVALRGHDLVPPVIELGSNAAVKGAVLAGTGPAVLSALAVAPELGAGLLQEVATTGLDLRRQLRAVWPRGRRLLGPAAALLAVASQSRRRPAAEPLPGGSARRAASTLSAE